MSDYEGVTHAGVAVVAADTGLLFLSHRTFDESDDPTVQSTWEFPGGGVNDGEDPEEAMRREWAEEVGMDFPPGEVVDGWRAGPDSDTGNYQGFVFVTPTEFSLEGFVANDEVDEIGWFNAADVDQENSHGRLRPEVATATPWDKVWGAVSRNQEDTMPDEDIEPEYSAEAFDLDGPIPVHGIIAPEELPSGDRRAFSKGAMTRRPLAIPLRDTLNDIGGHDGAFQVGRVDRMMRKGGMVHYEGALMPGKAEGLVEKMQFMDGKYGVSVDGDQGSMDAARTEETGTLWFDSIRAAGLTAVDIPAFHEAHVAFGLHPDMPEDEALTASAFATGDYAGARSEVLAASAVRFKRGPGWVTNPKETNQIHKYWTQKGQPGYAKVGWGTRGDFTRAKRLIGAKIAEHSPEKMKYLNQIIAQWHFDALGYWPGDLDKPGNKTSAEAKAERTSKASLAQHLSADLDRDDIEVAEKFEEGTEESVWEAVLVSSVSGNRKRPPLSYFHQPAEMVSDVWGIESGAMVVEEPDANGFRRTWGWAAQWGVCHTGMDGRCVEPPRSFSDDYPDFHLGRTKTEDGYVYTGVLTYGVGHRDAKTILAESPEQAMFDNIKNAWAAVRVGENERGIWFSGVVLPKMDEDDLVKIEASGQVSGEWLAGEMRACLTVNVPGFPNQRATAAYDENGNVVALAASAFGTVSGVGPCSDGSETDDPMGELVAEVWARIKSEQEMDLLRQRWAQDEFAAMQRRFNNDTTNTMGA